MQKTSKNKRQFCVVHFLESPLEDIDDYVCVPASWIIWGGLSDQKALVTYPIDVDAFKIKKRAKRKEKPANYWNVYTGVITYESDTQSEISLNRKLRSANQSSWPDPKMDKPQLAVKPYKNPRKPMVKISLKRLAQPELNVTSNKKRSKSNKAARDIVNYPSMIPESSKRSQLIVIHDDHLIHSDLTEKTVATSNNETIEQSIQPNQAAENMLFSEPDPSSTDQFSLSKNDVEKHLEQIFQDRKQEPSTPIIEVTEPIEIIDTTQEVQSDGDTEKAVSSNETPSTSKQYCQAEPVVEMQVSVPCPDNQLQEILLQEIPVILSTENNNQETNLYSNVIDMSKSLNRACQASEPNQKIQFSYLTVGKNSHSNSQLKEINNRRSTTVTNDDQRPRSYDETGNTPSTSYNTSTSVQLSTQLLEKQRRKSSFSIIKKPIHTETCHGTKIKNIPTDVKHSSKSILQSRLLPPPAVVRQASSVIQNHWQEVLPVMHTESHNERNSTDPRFSLQGIVNKSQEIQRGSEIYTRRSNEENRVDHRASYKDIASNPFAIQNLLSLASRSGCFGEKLHEQQYLPTQEDFSQKTAHVYNILTRSKDVQIPVQKANNHNDVNEMYSLQNQPNPVNQPSQFLSQHKSNYLPVNHNYLQQERLRQEQLGRFSMDTHTYHRPNPQHISISGVSVAQNPLKYVINQKPGQQLVTKNMSSSIPSKISDVTRQSLLTTQGSCCVLQDPCVQVPLNKISTKQDNMNRAALPRSTLVESTPMIQNIEIRPTFFNQSQQTQFTPIMENLIYQHPYKRKLVVNRSTEVDFIMISTDSKGETDRSFGVESSPMVLDSACQVDEYLMEEPPPLNQKATSDHEVFTNDKIVSEQEVALDLRIITNEAPVETVNTIDSTEENITPGNMLNKIYSEIANPDQMNLQSTGKDNPFGVRNSSNLANQFSQISESLSFSKDFLQPVLYSTETPVRQNSEVDEMSHTLSSQSRMMNIQRAAPVSSNLTLQCACTKCLNEKQVLPNNNFNAHQDSCVQHIIVDGSVEADYIQNSAFSEKNKKRQSVEYSMEKKIKTIDEGITDDASSTQDVGKDEQSSSTEISTRERLITNQNLDEHARKTVGSLTNIEEVWLDQLANLFNKMNTDFVQICKAADDIRGSLRESAQSFECITHAIKNLK